MHLFKFQCVLVTVSFLGFANLLRAHETSTDRMPQIVENKTGQVITLNDLVAKIGSCEVIFLGEKHDNDSGHKFQLEVIQKLIESGHDLVISTEQFERDVQGAVDDYLADRITEEQFLAASRPWKNYSEHYRAIIETAKQKKIPVLAANLPRYLAANIASGKSLQPYEQVFAPRLTTAPDDRYRTNFVESMKGHMGTEGADKLQAIYASQCAKDDAMAEAITDYLSKNRHRSRTVVHLCGHFHSDFGLGTAARVGQRNPLLRNAIVTMESVPKSGQLHRDGMLERAHFTFWTIENLSKSNQKNEELPAVK